MLEYLGNAIYGSFIANMIIGLLGVVASVAGSIVLDKLVFGPRAKDKNASKAAKVANGQHFLPLSFIRIGYYACAIYLVFLGISMFPLLGISGVPAFFGVAVIGNIVLHFDCVELTCLLTHLTSDTSYRTYAHNVFSFIF